MLAALAPASLARMRFPLGELTKPEVRELARDAGLPVADKARVAGPVLPRRHRQDARSSPATAACASGPGRSSTAPAGTLGRHRGQHLFTVGQRKGLGVARRGAALRARQGPRANTVVGRARAPSWPRREVAVRDAVLHRPGAEVDASSCATARGRWPARVAARGRRRARCGWREPVDGAAPGPGRLPDARRRGRRARRSSPADEVPGGDASPRRRSRRGRSSPRARRRGSARSAGPASVGSGARRPGFESRGEPDVEALVEHPVGVVQRARAAPSNAARRPVSSASSPRASSSAGASGASSQAPCGKSQNAAARPGGGTARRARRASSVERDDQRARRLLHPGVQAGRAVGLLEPVLVQAHPAVLVDHAGRRDAGSGHRRAESRLARHMTSDEIRERFLSFFAERGPPAAALGAAHPAQRPVRRCSSARGCTRSSRTSSASEQPPHQRLTDCAEVLPHASDIEVVGTHLPAPHVLRDARQLLARRLLQGGRGRVRVGASRSRASASSRRRSGSRSSRATRRSASAPTRRRSRRGWRSACRASGSSRSPAPENFWQAGPTGPVRPVLRALPRPRARVRRRRRAARRRQRALPRVLEPRLHAVRPEARGRPHAAAGAEHRHRARASTGWR